MEELRSKLDQAAKQWRRAALLFLQHHSELSVRRLRRRAEWVAIVAEAWDTDSTPAVRLRMSIDEGLGNLDQQCVDVETLVRRLELRQLTLAHGRLLDQAAVLRTGSIAKTGEPMPPTKPDDSRALAIGMLMEGQTIKHIFEKLGVRRGDFYERDEWATVRHIYKTIRGAKHQAHADRRSGQNPDSSKNPGED